MKRSCPNHLVICLPETILSQTYHHSLDAILDCPSVMKDFIVLASSIEEISAYSRSSGEVSRFYITVLICIINSRLVKLSYRFVISALKPESAELLFMGERIRLGLSNAACPCFESECADDLEATLA